MHFLEVLMIEERYKHKILAELRGGFSVSIKMSIGGDNVFPRR